MNNIKVQQNKPENLQLLATQRVVYERAKSIFHLQVFLTVGYAVILNFIRLLPKETLIDISPYIITFSVIFSVIDLLVFTQYISKMRTNGAKVQEQFDCSVYQMLWNDYNSGLKVDRNFIHDNFKRYIPDATRPIENWYDINLDDLSQVNAILLCQETNLWYDSNLREKFKNTTIYFLIALAAISLLISLITKQQVGMMFIQIVSPLMPAIVLAIKLYQENDKSIKASNELKKAVYTLRKSNIEPSMEDLRKIQDKIFCSRKDSSLVPEWFYRRERRKLEDGMKINAS